MRALPENKGIRAISAGLEGDRNGGRRARRRFLRQHMEEDSVFGVAWVALMQRKLAPGLAVSVLGALALLTTSGNANPPNVKGKISGFEKLVPEIYMETAKPDSRRWTWREPSPSVAVTWTVYAPVCVGMNRNVGRPATVPGGVTSAPASSTFQA